MPPDTKKDLFLLSSSLLKGKKEEEIEVSDVNTHTIFGH